MESHSANFANPSIMIVSESIFCESPIQSAGFPIQFSILIHAFLFCTGFVPYAIAVNEINVSRYGFLIEFSVPLLWIIYLLKISLLFTTILIP